MKLLVVFVSTALLAWWSVSFWNQRLAYDLDDLAPSQIDLGFAQAMTAHHQQAIFMARLMMDGRPTQLQQLSTQIVQAQLYEQGEMQGWLKLWRAPLVVEPVPMDWMLLGSQPLSPALSQYLIDCKTSPGGMPGLATREQIEMLRTLDGEQRDIHFLQLMLAHHQGGIPMAGFAASQGKLDVVRRLATSVVLDQTEEMRRLHYMLGVLQMNAAQTNSQQLVKGDG